LNGFLHRYEVLGLLDFCFLDTKFQRHKVLKEKSFKSSILKSFNLCKSDSFDLKLKIKEIYILRQKD